MLLHRINILYILFTFIFLCSCQTVHVTRQYYQEHINPKACIDYECRSFDNFPQDFLNKYYDIDSKFVDLQRDLTLLEYPSTEELSSFSALKSLWIRSYSFVDQDFIYKSGDEVLPFAYDFAGKLQKFPANEYTNLCIFDADHYVLVNALKIAFKKYRYALLEIDLKMTFADINEKNFGIIADGISVMPLPSFDDATILSVVKNKQYSGSAKRNGQKIYWIRSFAVDNLIYFYSEEKN